MTWFLKPEILYVTEWFFKTQLNFRLEIRVKIAKKACFFQGFDHFKNKRKRVEFSSFNEVQIVLCFSALTHIFICFEKQKLGHF